METGPEIRLIARRANRARRSSGERGMALVAVLGVLAVVAVMAAHLTLITEISARESRVSAERSRLRYVAESAADRAMWMHLVDRRLFSNRTLGQTDLAREESGLDGWMLDGRPHEIEGALCSVSLVDADRGIDLNGKDLEDVLTNQGDPEDEALQDRIRDFLDIARDYMDENDLTRLYGKEKEDYIAEGQPTLPRDAPMQYREEAFWLAGWDEILFGNVRLIPPAGLRFPNTKRRGKPPFFSSSAGMIRERGRLDESDLQLVLEARQSWLADGVPLDEALDGDLLGRIRSNFSFTETAIATFVVEASSKDGLIRRQLRITRDCNVSRSSAYNDSQRQAWALWERTVF